MSEREVSAESEQRKEGNATVLLVLLFIVAFAVAIGLANLENKVRDLRYRLERLEQHQ